MAANHTPDWLIEARSSNTSHNVMQQQISYTNLSLRTLDHDSKSILPTNHYSYPNLTCPVEVDHAPPVFWYDVLALFTIIGFPISLISNAIIIYLFTRTQSLRNNPSNIIAVNLSLSDLLLCAQWPIVIYCSLTQSTWILDSYLVCQTFGFISTITAFTSILTVLAMSLERAFVICFSMTAKSQFTTRIAWFITVLIWLLSFIANLPPLVLKRTKYTLDPSRTGCFVDYLPQDPFVKIYILLLSIFFFVLPAALIFISYIMILVAFKRSSKSLRRIDVELQSSNSTVEPHSNGLRKGGLSKSRGFGRLRDSLRLKNPTSHLDTRGNPKTDIHIELGRRASASAAVTSEMERRSNGLEKNRRNFKRYLSESIMTGLRSSSRPRLLRSSVRLNRIRAFYESGKRSAFCSQEADSQSDSVARTPNSLFKQPFTAFPLHRSKRSTKHKGPLQSGRSSLQIRLAVTSLYLILLWLVSWTPLGLLALINSLTDCRRASATAVLFASTMTKLGPTFDVFIYGISHPKIKSRFKHIIKSLFLFGPMKRMGLIVWLFWTLVWGGVGIGLRNFVPPGPDQGIIQTGLSLTAACCYILWFCAYLAQMNPLFGPQLSNITLALMSRNS